MEFSGRYVIPAAPEAVWQALNQPEVLKACISGCEALTKTDATHFAATAVLKIGPVRAAFRANIEQSELDPPRRCVLKGEGQGGVAGFARGEAEVLIAPEGCGTVLTYNAKASIGGKLAQIGQRLIDGAARQIADEFFARFAAEVAAAAPVEAPAGMPVAAAPPVVVPTDEEEREGIAPQVWVVGLLGVIAILLVVFGLVLKPS